MDDLEYWTTLGDCLLAFFAHYPAVCLYWRGSWDTIGYYIFPTREPLNHWVSFGIGWVCAVNYLFLPLLNKHLDFEKKIQWWIYTRLFMYLQAACYMCYWRGTWWLFDYYLGRDWENCAICLAISQALLVFLRCQRMCMWPPMFVTLDTRRDLLDTPTNRFGTSAKTPVLYVLDSFFTQLVTNAIAICSWRSAWNIYDAIIYPDHPLRSNIVSALMGFIGLVLFITFQKFLAKVSRTLENRGGFYMKLIWEDAVYIVIFAFLLLWWRGGWNLQTTYFFPELPLGGWVSHCVGAVILFSMQTFSYVGWFGCIIDGNDPGGEAFFPLHYLRIYLLPYLRRRRAAKTDLDIKNIQMSAKKDSSVYVISDEKISASDGTLTVN